jgi:hypothetical protein
MNWINSLILFYPLYSEVVNKNITASAVNKRFNGEHRMMIGAPIGLFYRVLLQITVPLDGGAGSWRVRRRIKSAAQLMRGRNAS